MPAWLLIWLLLSCCHLATCSEFKSVRTRFGADRARDEQAQPTAFRRPTRQELYNFDEKQLELEGGESFCLQHCKQVLCDEQSIHVAVPAPVCKALEDDEEQHASSASVTQPWFGHSLFFALGCLITCIYFRLVAPSERWPARAADSKQAACQSPGPVKKHRKEDSCDQKVGSSNLSEKSLPSLPKEVRAPQTNSDVPPLPALDVPGTCSSQPASIPHLSGSVLRGDGSAASVFSPDSTLRQSQPVAEARSNAQQQSLVATNEATQEIRLQAVSQPSDDTEAHSERTFSAHLEDAPTADTSSGSVHNTPVIHASLVEPDDAAVQAADEPGSSVQCCELLARQQASTCRTQLQAFPSASPLLHTPPPAAMDSTCLSPFPAMLLLQPAVNSSSAQASSNQHSSTSNPHLHGNSPQHPPYTVESPSNPTAEQPASGVTTTLFWSVQQQYQQHQHQHHHHVDSLVSAQLAAEGLMHANGHGMLHSEQGHSMLQESSQGGMVPHSNGGLVDTIPPRPKRQQRNPHDSPSAPPHPITHVTNGTTDLLDSTFSPLRSMLRPPHSTSQQQQQCQPTPQPTAGSRPLKILDPNTFPSTPLPGTPPKRGSKGCTQGALNSSPSSPSTPTCRPLQLDPHPYTTPRRPHTIAHMPQSGQHPSRLQAMTHQGLFTPAHTTMMATPVPAGMMMTPGLTNMMTPGTHGMMTPGPHGMVTPGPHGMMTPGPHGRMTPGPHGMMTPGPHGMVTPGTHGPGGMMTPAHQVMRNPGLTGACEELPSGAQWPATCPRLTMPGQHEMGWDVVPAGSQSVGPRAPHSVGPPDHPGATVPTPFIIRQTRHTDGTMQQELICSDATSVAHAFGPALHGINVIATVLQQMSGSVASLNDNLSLVSGRAATLAATMQGWLELQALQDQGDLVDRCMAVGLLVQLGALLWSTTKHGRLAHVLGHCLGNAAGPPSPPASRWSVGRLLGWAPLPFAAEGEALVGFWSRGLCVGRNMGLLGMAVVLLAVMFVFAKHLTKQQVRRTWMVDVPLMMLLGGAGGAWMVHGMGAAWALWLLLWWAWCGCLAVMSEVQLSFWPRMGMVVLLAAVNPLACGLGPFRAPGVEMWDATVCRATLMNVPWLAPWLPCGH